MQKKIHIILPRIEGSKKTKHKILKVAIYCRVSKNTPEQLRSLEIQESTVYKGLHRVGI